MNDPAEDIRLAALAHALKDIKAGMENMSKVIRAKMLHPIITSIKNTDFKFDIDEHRRKYKEEYLDKHNERPRD